MSAMVRRGGRATLDDGTELTWSAADGHRGRRWRAATTRDGHLAESLLLEVDNDGRPTRLELNTAGGLLTLHPEPSGGLHGNVVTPTGIRHLALAWTGDHELAIDRLPMVAAVAARRLAVAMGVGEGREVEVVKVAPDLTVSAGTRRFVRATATDWRIEGPEGSHALTVDERGLPVWPRSRGESRGAEEASGPPEEWPLELETTA